MRVRVLIVDDQAVFRQVMRAAIELMDGFEVCAEAETGQSALELLANARPSCHFTCVVLDSHWFQSTHFVPHTARRHQVA
jgi:DNA-binding NarL/FixJ family response regulator